MPRYNYMCCDCEREVENLKGSALTHDELLDVIFETSHQMSPTVDELAEAKICPRCQGSNTEKTLIGTSQICYVKGNGYLDKAGCKRDMNLLKLQREDPYAEYREPGEVDDLTNRLRKGGQHDPKPIHFLK